MHTYTHELTTLETLCGVTLEDVADILPRGLFREIDGRECFIVPNDVFGPALAHSVARCAFGGTDAEYLHKSPLGYVFAREVA